MNSSSVPRLIQALRAAPASMGRKIKSIPRLSKRLRWLATDLLANLLLATAGTWAQGFDKVNTTVTNVNTILVTISVAVVTIAVIWAGMKMIFQAARLADVAHILLGGTLIGGATAIATYIVN